MPDRSPINRNTTGTEGNVDLAPVETADDTETSVNRSNPIPPNQIAGQGTGRAGSIELLRILGAFGIVMFHLNSPGASIGYGALPMFIYLSVFFALNQGARQPWKAFVQTRLNRLLVPWAFWSLVFLGLKIAQAQIEGRPIRSEFNWWHLATGPAIHLWFLPFIAAVSVGLRAIWWAIVQLDKMVVLGVSICLAFLCVFALGYTSLGPPFEQWLFGLIPVLLAVTEVRFTQTRAPGRKPMIFVPWIAGLLVVATLGTGISVVPFLVAIGLIVAAGLVQFPTTPTIKAIASLSLGVYVIHPLVAALMKVAGANPWNGSLASLGAVYGLSILATVAVQRTPFFGRFV